MARHNPDDVTVVLTGRYAALARGDILLEDLDDEELSRCKLRASDGSFSGPRPRALPTKLVQDMRREWLSRAETKLRAALLDKGLGTLVELAGDTTIDPNVRLRAALTIIDRNMGKVPDRVVLATEDPVEALFRGILSDPLGLAPHEMSAEERELIS